MVSSCRLILDELSEAKVASRLCLIRAVQGLGFRVQGLGFRV